MPEWDAAWLARLRELWGAENKPSTGAIGRSLSSEFHREFSKNAIVGKAHRLKLEPRPSPIQFSKDGVTQKNVRHDRAALVRASRTATHTLPALNSEVVLPVVAKVRRVPKPRKVRAAPVVLPPVPVPEPVAWTPASRKPQCKWPIGEPGTNSFRFCTTEAEPSRPYCAEHCKIAFIKVRERREDAA